MKRIITTLGLAAVVFVGQAVAAEKGFETIFDGKTLKGWNGDPKFWSVQDGAITGKTSKENPTKGNTFIIWEGKTGDFDLRLDYKIIGGNSGIQYRSFKADGADEWRIGGYQADFEAGDTFSGICYGERFRGILSLRGKKTTLTVGEDGKLKKAVEEFAKDADIAKAIKKEDWNNYRIVARNFSLTHYINGVKTTQVIDRDKKTRRADGLLALQLHAGPPMNVQFKNIRIKELPKRVRKAGSAKKKK
ncbi:MAG TPA: DUF1080 domain-containing protein [Verrucomicrobiota bacterium]|jgi:hypothetical protein|nr:DUF1080 domain-containing protein [Verrucomicrobiota bacterium]